MWADNETTVDLLGFDLHRDLLEDLVTNRDLLPVTVGLFGDWGGGKSSVMRMLQTKLQATEGVICLYFNGWTFEGYEDAKTALIASILIELGNNRTVGHRVRDDVVRLLHRVDLLKAAALVSCESLEAVGPVDPRVGLDIGRRTAVKGGVENRNDVDEVA